ncbi:MAG TPA: hypothetical protein VFZ25_14095 [Chloroflexota bacterium]|nr:hypothetical protein [Chloroflexota bacterium]
MAQHGRTLYDYAQDHQWVRMMGWSDQELRSVPIHYEATSHATTGPEDEYLNLANFGNTGLGVTSLGMGGGTSADTRSLQNIYVYRSDCPPQLYDRLRRTMEEEKPAAGAEDMLKKEGNPNREQRRAG